MQLTDVEQRIIGCLIEKERATPQNYPLTLNSLRLACNQSSNRDPVVDYDDVSIDHALASLREKGMTRIVYSTSNRAAKYRHIVDESLRLGDDELAVLAILLLRGAQTIGEIKGRTDRLFAFDDLGQVQSTLERLAAREDGAFVERLERRPGQKDARYVHTLGPSSAELMNRPTNDPRSVPDSSDEWHGGEPNAGFDAPSHPSPDSKLGELIDEVARLRLEVDALTQGFAEFRAQFD